MATELQVDYDEIRRRMATMLGWERDPANWSATEIADGERIIRGGLRKFYYPPPVLGEKQGHRWSFLEPRYDIETTSPFSTGTIEVVNGVVTLTGGSFPTWATDAWFNYDHGRHTVSSYDSATQITLDNTALNVAAGSEYSLRRYRYILPAEFAGFEGPLTFLPNQSVYYQPPELVDEFEIRSRYQDEVTNEWHEPRLYAVFPEKFDATVGQRYVLTIWPEADKRYVLTSRMRVEPFDLDATNRFPLGGDQHAETIVEAILSEAEAQMHDHSGVHTERFMACLVSSVSHDRQTNAPDTLGVLPQLSRLEDGYYLEGRPYGYARGTAQYKGYEGEY